MTFIFITIFLGVFSLLWALWSLRAELRKYKKPTQKVKKEHVIFMRYAHGKKRG